MKKLLCLVAFAIISSASVAQLSTPNNSKPIQFLDSTTSEYANIVTTDNWRGVVISIPETISNQAISWDIYIDYRLAPNSYQIPLFHAASFPAFLTDPTPSYDLKLEYQLTIILQDSLIIETGEFNL